MRRGLIRNLSLNDRLLLIVALALLPVSVLIVLQGSYARQHLDELAAERLIANANATALAERQVFDRVERQLRWFSREPAVLNVTAACGDEFRKTMAFQSAVVNFVRSDAEGNIVCSGLPYETGTNFRGDDWWQQGKAARKMTVSAPTFGAVSKRRVMIGMWPLYNQDGSYRGAITAGLQLSWLENSIADLNLSPTSIVSIVDADGKVLMKTGSQPLQRVDVRAANRRVTDVALSDGSFWLVSTAPIFQDKLFVVFAEPKTQLLASARSFWIQTLFVPIAILLFTSIAVWWGVQNMVIKWLQRLREKTLKIASGTYVYDAKMFDGASPEIVQFADTLKQMADDIDAQKSQLSEALERAQGLTREINHRVKNNLQIILSLLHMQRAEVDEPVMRQILSQTISRMGAVAATQRLTYETSEVADAGHVDMGALVGALAQQLRGAFPDNDYQIQATSGVGVLPIAQALPIALIVVEAVTNAIVHGLGSKVGHVEIGLTTEGERAVLTIRDNGRGYDAKEDRQKLGLALIDALTSQLNGENKLKGSANSGTLLRVSFPLNE